MAALPILTAATDATEPTTPATTPGVSSPSARRPEVTVSHTAASAALLSSLLVELRTTEDHFVADLSSLAVGYLQPLRDRACRASPRAT